jgi:hypothetical protein
LPDPFPGDAEHAADFLERVLAAAVQPEIQAEDLGVARRQGLESGLDLVGEEPFHRRLFGVRKILGDEPFDERPIALGVERSVEPHLTGVERGQRLHDLEREVRGLGDFFRRGFAPQLLAQGLGRPDDLGQVGRAVEGHPHRPPMAGERGENGLPDPPDRVRNELDALVRVELPGRGEQADVALADQVGEGQAPVLVFLGDRDHEAEVPLGQLLHGRLVAGPYLPGERDFLRRLEQRSLADLIEVLVEQVAIVLVDGDRRRRATAALLATLLGLGHGGSHISLDTPAVKAWAWYDGFTIAYFADCYPAGRREFAASHAACLTPL